VSVVDLGYDSTTGHMFEYHLFSIDIEEQTTNYIARIYTLDNSHPYMFNYDFVSSKTGIFSVKDISNDIYSIYLTDDSLQTWSKIYSSENEIYSIVMTSDNNIGFISVDSNCNWFYGYSDDKGASWQKTYLPEADNAEMNTFSNGINISFYDENLGFMLGYVPSDTSLSKYYTLLKTTDGGKHWSIINTLDEKYYTNILIHFQFADTNTMMVFRYPNILYSRDGGKNWILLPKCMYQGNSMVIYNYALCPDGSVLVPSHIDLWGNQIFSRGQFVTGIEDDTGYSTYASTMLFPNPTTDNTTLTLKLQQASQVRISLNDMLGREIKQIYSDFVGADASPLQITFSTQELPKGVYYLKILNGGEMKVEKVVVK
jgi:hypothetical protein